MSKSIYARLAFNNLKNDARRNLPYILTASITVMMFYIMLFLTFDEWVLSSTSLASVLVLGCVVIAIFSMIFLFYTNSFLIKRRKREFGLYNVLGMEKRHICHVLAIENLTISFVGIVAGLLCGILFSKLTLLFLAKILVFDGSIAFSVPPLAVIITVVFFALVFTLTLLYDLAQIRLAKPVELLRGGNVGEREPKANWLLAAAGLLMLGGGYYLAQTTEKPIAALGIFFIAVVLVILGTYCLFIAGSIAVLKLLRNNKRYYYKLRHFTSVSGMLYRMKKNAVGLANVCILSTMVLVMLSSTSCLFIGFEDSLRETYPRNIEVHAGGVSAESAEQIAALAGQAVSEQGVTAENLIFYRYLSLSLLKTGNTFTQYYYDQASSDSIETAAYFITLDDYNRLAGDAESLGDGELIALEIGVELGNIISLNGDAYKVRHTDKISLEQLCLSPYNSSWLERAVLFVLPDDTAVRSAVQRIKTNRPLEEGMLFYYGFDINADSETQNAVGLAVGDLLYNPPDGQTLTHEYLRCRNVTENRAAFLEIYGGLFFLGIILGLLFIMAAVLIIYYKQVSEGYEDKIRFEIMQKVGMSSSEVKRSIRSQVLTVFFLPLAVAVMHVIFAFKIITKMLYMLDLTNVSLFAACTAVTIAVFAVFYTIVYLLTAKAYNKIVE